MFCLTGQGVGGRECRRLQMPCLTAGHVLCYTGVNLKLLIIQEICGKFSQNLKIRVRLESTGRRCPKCPTSSWSWWGSCIWRNKQHSISVTEHQNDASNAPFSRSVKSTQKWDIVKRKSALKIFTFLPLFLLINAALNIKRPWNMGRTILTMEVEVLEKNLSLCATLSTVNPTRNGALLATGRR